MFALYDELFLLALDEEKGNFLPFTKKTISFGLAGALLGELALRGKLCSNPKQRLELIDKTPTGEALLDQLIAELDASEKHKKAAWWVGQLSERPKKLRQEIGEALAARGIVTQDEAHFRRAPAPSGELASVPSKFELKKSLREIALGGGDVDPHGLALLNILSACGLLDLVFTIDELDAAKQSIYENIMQAALKAPALETIEGIGHAVVVSLEDRDD